MWVCAFGVPNCPICPMKHLTGVVGEVIHMKWGDGSHKLHRAWGDGGWYEFLCNSQHDDGRALALLDELRSRLGDLWPALKAAMTEEGREEYARLMALRGPSAQDILEEAQADREAADIHNHLKLARTHGIQAPQEPQTLLDELLEEARD